MEDGSSAAAAAATLSRPDRRVCNPFLGTFLLSAVGLVLLCAPVLLGSYELRLATTICMYIALAQSWNLIGGYAGLMSIAQPAFFGTGAIVTALLLINGASLPVVALASVVCGAVLALVVGIPTLRLQGHYFVAATLLMSEALRNLVLNMDAFGFNGSISVNLSRYAGLEALNGDQYGQLFYYVMLTLAAASMLMVAFVEHSRLSLALKALRDNSIAATALGVPGVRLRLLVFLASGAIACVAGSLWALWLGAAETNDAYRMSLAFEIILMVLLGGSGTLWGPVVGVVVISLINEIIGVEFAEISLMLSGLIVMLIVLFQPDGLIRIAHEGLGAFAPKTLVRNLRRYRLR